MKLLIGLLTVLTMILFISACRNDTTFPSVETQTDMNSSFDYGYDDFFDSNMLSRPTDEDIAKITVGMSFREVIEIIGKPHCHAPGPSLPYFQWVTAEGSKYVILFLPEDVSYDRVENDMTMFERFENTVVVFSPGKVPAETTLVEYCPLSYEEFMQKVSEEMNEDEIVAIAGEPQRIEWVNLSIDPSASAMLPYQCRIYDFINDNRSIGIVYYFKGEPSDDTARTLIHVFVSEDQTT